MRVLPKTDEEYPPLLLVRTDFRDETAWLRLRAALDQPWVFDEDAGDGGGLKEEILSVDDPQWAEATFADVLAALTAPEDGEEPSECGWDVVFLADAASMAGAEPTLLAVSTDPEEPTAPYRIPALGTPHAMHCNLALANMDFEEFEEF
ncbi:DUF6924 domain-containing protein [Streptomyces sp. NPDC006012]|uniref:DUF6924 domain-containing protein n=1 Tax=Streptomyces sp. NPDC006012 TaxID=3364739 RepID=UPI00367FD929